MARTKYSNLKDQMLNESLLTFDIDWAPDFTIDYLIDYLIEKNIKSTWFITHDSPAIRRIIQREDLFEIGLHPNFLPMSTQGKNEDEVMEYLLKICPKSKLIRTHALYQSTFLLRKLVQKYKIETDVSLLLPHTPNLVPHNIHLGENLPKLIRVPYFWEDDIEMYNPNNNWNLKYSWFNFNGLKIFNFHPIHVYLNSHSVKNYELIKERESINNLAKEKCKQYINKTKKGVNDFFKELCNYISENQKISYTISEIIK